MGPHATGRAARASTTQLGPVLWQVDGPRLYASRRCPRLRGRENRADQGRYYETLVEASPTAIVACDPEFIVTSWNPAAERLFG